MKEAITQSNWHRDPHRTITLTQVVGVPSLDGCDTMYRVIQVTNCLALPIATHLTAEQVEGWIARGYEVILV